MKILIIFNKYQYRGGEDTYVDNLTLLLQNNGHTVKRYIKDSRSIKSIRDKLRTALGLFWNFQTSQELSSIIKQFKPEIAHFHNIYPHVSPSAYYICRKNKVKIVQTIHNYKFMCPKNSLFRRGKVCELCIHKSFFYPSIFFGCYHKSRLASLFFSISFFIHRLLRTFDLIDIFIFPSPFTRDYYRKNISYLKDKSVVIPYFVNTKVTNSLSISQGKYFVYVGRLSEEKGIIQLLDVIKTLPHIVLRVIGDGPLRKTIALSYSKYNNIIFHRRVPHASILKYIKRAEATIVPSLWYEVQPNVILESFACGVPVILCHNKNYQSWIPIKKVGIQYRSDDAESMKETILSFSLNKPSLTKHNILEEFNKKYTPDRHYKSIISLYNGLLR